MAHWAHGLYPVQAVHTDDWPPVSVREGRHPNPAITHRMETRGNQMAALIDTRDEDDDDGTAALYKDSGTDEDEEFDEEDTDEPIAGVDEDEDENEEIDEEAE